MPAAQTMSNEDIEAYFLLLQGENGGGLDGVIAAESIKRMCRELQLDTSSATSKKDLESIKSFCDENVELMVESGDQSGKGAMSLGDFRSLVRQVMLSGGSG